jgi:hypothetical protein
MCHFVWKYVSSESLSTAACFHHSLTYQLKTMVPSVHTVDFDMFLSGHVYIGNFYETARSNILKHWERFRLRKVVIYTFWLLYFRRGRPPVFPEV